MKKASKSIVLLAIVLALTYCWYNPHIRGAFLGFNLNYLPLIILYSLMFYGLNGLAIYLLARKSSREVTLLPMLGLSQFSSLVGYILPFRVAVIGVRAAYLKRRFKIPYGETVGGGLLLTFMNLLISSFILLFFGFNYVRNIISEQILMVIGLSALMIIIAITLFAKRHKLNTLFDTYLSKLASLKRGLTQFSYADILLLFVVTALTIVVSAYINLALIDGVGMSASIYICLLLAAAGNVSFLVALAPASIGTKELFYVGVGAIYGLTAESIIAFLIIDRLIQILILIVSSCVFYFTQNDRQSLLRKTNFEINT